jgi:Flp pilus assembly protein TadB
MKTFLVATCVWLACYLAMAPLPGAFELPKFKLVKTKFRKRKKMQMNFDEKLQFIYCIKIQLLAGSTQIAALQFALSRINDSFLPETRKSISLRSEIFTAMKNDAVEFEFWALADYALLMQASARSGASISQPLSNLASTMIRNRTQEQLLTTELASTKATVLLLAGLPIIGSGLAMMLGSQSINWLITTGLGRGALFTGLALELLGWVWVQRLLANALRDPS